MLVPTVFEVHCTSLLQVLLKKHTKYGSALFPFPLFALHEGQEEECWKIENRKHQESLQIVLTDKTKNTGIVCMCMCVFDLLIFGRGIKSPIFDLFIGISLCLCPNRFISYSVNVKISLCAFLSDSGL